MVVNIQGIDHVGVTVPDIEKVTEIFIWALNAVVLYDFYPHIIDAFIIVITSPSLIQ